MSGTAEGAGPVAVLPARGGSKRIPRKNVRSFHGRPLIAWTIDTLLATAVVERVVVSTDDDEIAEVATAAGAEVPFRRPPELSDDTTGTGAVIRHAIETLEAQTSAPLSTVCLIYPGAVFVTADDLQAAHAALVDHDVDYVFTVTPFATPIERALLVDDDGLVGMRQPEHLLTRSQDLPTSYHDVGQFYWGRRDAWMAAVPVMQGRSRAHVIPAWRVQDIDEPDDWTRAELLFETMQRLS